MRASRLLFLPAIALLAACGASGHDQSFSAPSAPTTTQPTADAQHGHVRAPSKVLLIVEENHSQREVAAGMPRLAADGRRYGHTTDYRALGHPSLPNYLGLVGGSTFGITDDDDPSAHPISGASVFDQAIAAHRSARAYAESMSGRCELHSSGRYAVRHNPWTYFSSARSRANCRRNDVPSGTPTSGRLRRDVLRGRLPAVGMLVPNLCDDAHDCGLSVADRWLARWMTVIRRGSDWRSGRLAVVVTFDEDDGSQANTVLTTVMSTSTSHVVSRRHFTHYSFTRYADALIGRRPLRRAAHARSLGPAFHL